MILSVHKQPTMTTALRDCLNAYAPGTTFEDILWDCSHPADDTIAWHIAEMSAAMHSCLDDLRTDYGTTSAFGGVDAGEFLVWLGY